MTVAKLAPPAASGHVYVANSTVETLSQYTVSTGGGLVAMTPASVSTAPFIPGELELNPSGQSLYISLINQDGPSRIGQFHVGTDGALSPMTPPSIATAAGPIEIVPTPDGKFLYVENQLASVISQYSIGADGSLTPLVPVSVAPAGGAGELTMSPSGKFLYSGSTYGISQFAIGADGQLSPLSPATAAGPGVDLKVSPDGKFLYASGLGVSQYGIATNGQLTPLEPVAVATQLSTLELELAGNGKFLFATAVGAGFKGQVTPFSIGADGQLTALAPAMAPAGNFASEAVVSPDSAFLYAGNLSGATPPATDSISQFSIDPGGTLTPLNPATMPTGAGAGALAATPPPELGLGGGTNVIPTTTSYTGPSTSGVGQAAALSARLTVSGTGTPLAAMPLQLVLNSQESCTAVTKADGTAACSVKPSEKAGTYPVTAAFAGTATYAASSASGRLLLHATSTLLVTPAAVTTPPPTAAPDPPATTTSLPTAPSLAVTGTSDHGELAGLAVLVLAMLALALLHRARLET